jgi:hypothetical protein
MTDPQRGHQRLPETLRGGDCGNPVPARPTLGLTVTAECVETAGQAARLRRIGCDTGQDWPTRERWRLFAQAAGVMLWLSRNMLAGS